MVLFTAMIYRKAVPFYTQSDLALLLPATLHSSQGCEINKGNISIVQFCKEVPKPYRIGSEGPPTSYPTPSLLPSLSRSPLCSEPSP